MSDQQEAWNTSLKATEATIKVQIEDILRELAKNIVSTVPAPSPVDNATENIGKTTSSASLSRRDIATQTDGHRASITIGPFPDGEAAVRADLSLTTAELIVQTSKAKGLDIALAESRDLAETLKAERSHLLATIASLESRLEISTMERQSVNKRLDLAGKEVKQLQDIICSFHNPQSKMFESIRDAVIRESNGQPPLHPKVLLNLHEVDSSTGQPSSKKRRREDLESNDSRPINPNQPALISPTTASAIRPTQPNNSRPLLHHPHPLARSTTSQSGYNIDQTIHHQGIPLRKPHRSSLPGPTTANSTHPNSQPYPNTQSNIHLPPRPFPLSHPEQPSNQASATNPPRPHHHTKSASFDSGSSQKAAGPPTDQIVAVPILPQDPLAQKLFFYLWETQAKTVAKCRYCGITMHLAGDYRTLWEHSSTVHHVEFWNALKQ